MKRQAFIASIVWSWSCICGAQELKKFTIGVEDYPNFLPYSEYKNMEYKGLGRAILDAFGKQAGYMFSYRVLPLKRRDSMFINGQLDFAFPDNPNWVTDLKKNVTIRYAPMLDFTDGVLVRNEDIGKGTRHLKLLGIPLGFTPYPYQQLMTAGALRVEESGNYDALYSKLIAHHIDGAYINTRIAQYYWTNVRQLKQVPVSYDPDLPHTSGKWYLSSIKYPKIIAEFDSFLRNNQPLIGELKKQYGFEDDQ